MATNPNASPDLFKKQLEETKPQRIQEEVKTLQDMAGTPKEPKAGGELPITQLSPSIEKLLTSAGKARSTRDIMGLRSQAVGEQLQATQAEGAAAQQVAMEQARLKGAYATQEAEAYKKIDDERQRKMAQAQIPDFNPTQDNLLTLGTMASLIAVVGAVVGQQGGLSGIGAVNAMAGMMKGYQAGRKDVFDREKVKFQNDMARLKAEQEKLMKEFEAAYKRIPYDMAQSRADMELALVKANSPLLKATYDKQGAEAVLKLLDASAKDVQHLENMALKVGLAQSKAAGKPLKDKEINQISGLESLAQSLEKLKKDFKPEYAGLGMLGFGAEMSMEAKRRLGTEEGEKAVSWWSKYAQLQAPNRHALYGATLTGNELKNYQEFTAKKSDAPNIVLGQLQDQIDYSLNTANQRRRSFESSGYQVPSAPPTDFLQTYSTTRAAPTEGGGYQVGQIIESGGKRYEVTKVYPDDPGNPEVKEVK